MSDLQDLKVKRASIKGRITKFKTYLDNLTADSSITLTRIQLHELNIKLSKFNSLLGEYDSVQDGIEAQMPDRLESELEDREMIENKCVTFMAIAQDIIMRHSNTSQNDNQTNSPHQARSSLNYKLPQMQINKFDGSYFQWIEFRDTFVSVIHDTDIPPINKFHYLISYLTGDAANIISNLEISAVNYDTAWQLLCDRYNNKRRLTNNHLNALFNIEHIYRESDKSLRAIIDNINKNLRALNGLGHPTDKWDTLLIHMISTKLDTHTSLKWEEYSNSLNNMPDLAQFLRFLNARADVLETHNQNKAEKYKRTLNGSKNGSNQGGYKQDKAASRSFSVVTQPDSAPAHSSPPRCVICSQGHRIYDCPTFLAKSIEGRLADATKLRLCLNCLRVGHNTKECRGGPCRQCNKRHNSLLHKTYTPASTAVSPPNPPTQVSTPAIVPADNLSVNLATQSISVSHVLLPTAQIQVVNPITKNGEVVRALLDSGSQASFISKSLKQRLKFATLPTNTIKIVGIGNTACNYINERCSVQLQSLQGNYNVTLTCAVLPELTGNLPAPRPVKLTLPPWVKLADPSYSQTSTIDILIGADLFWEVLSGELKSLGPELPMLANTKFGWVLSGRQNLNASNEMQCNFQQFPSDAPVFLDVEEYGISPNDVVPSSHANICSPNCASFEKLNNQIMKFWELEELPKPSSLLSEKEQACEAHFIQNTTRQKDGRFKVRLPLNDTPDRLGNSYRQAMKRFSNLEQRFRKQPQLKAAYCEFIQEYIELDHCSEISGELQEPSYFLCHHAVFRDQSESTKFRVVFDGSMPTSSGTSINDLQLVGPPTQDSLFSILVRFRQHKFVLSGDIEKMFRQILMHEDDRNFQLILWREDETQDIRILRLNTVTYGFASASYLSTRCLTQLGNECPDASIQTIIQKDFFCDDLLTGADSETELLHILNSVVSTLKEGSFNLRKFKSNLPSIFEASNVNLQENLSFSDSSHALGLGWSPVTDKLNFTIAPNDNDNMTKRAIVSSSFKTFDPLGLLAPATMQPKLLIQQLWVKKLEWDETIPKDLQREWKRIQSGFPSLSSIKLDRHVLCDNRISVELHSFCDASMLAYGACIYLRSTNADGEIRVKLLCAKSKVAPIKPTTIPRLELCGALLAARLSQAVVDSLRCPITRRIHWCDSSIVLAWLKTSPNKLKTFVANRVVEVNETTQQSSWRHVPTDANPADLISRGVDSDKLHALTQWWSGPPFLSMDESKWPSSPSSETETLPEIKSHAVDIYEPIIQFERFSKLGRLKRTMAYVLRFIHNCRNPTKLTGGFSVDELQYSNDKLTFLSQRESFPREYTSLSKGQPINTRSNLASLTPFLDGTGLMRVGGRLHASDYDYDKKHPAILCSKHHLANLIFQHEHVHHCHAGPQLLLYTVRESLWPVHGRHLARRTVRQCVTCRRHKGDTIQPIMGNLPSQRVTPAFPFQTTGVDYAGPFSILSKKGRGAKTFKCYLCLFICLRYKCVHLEAVSELSKDAFIASLRRFISRRGKPAEIFSDNGRNFVAAAKEVGSFLQSVSGPISDFATDEGIKFKFIPAYAPNFGGLWEAGIKSAKHHLVRVIGNTNLTFEELCTLFAQIEAILNSRPLCPLSSSPRDLQSLTPGHFLVGRPLTALPTAPIDERACLRSRHARLELYRQHFWHRWQREYISELQQRSKWRTNHGALRVDDLALLQEDGAPPLHWRMGRVARLHPGSDGVARVADVFTIRGSVRRALSRLCPLPTSGDSS